MDSSLLNFALILLFVLIGGFFAASEIAMVSLRPAQAAKLAERGRRGQRVARLQRDPNRFLAAVQVGVTLAGFFASSYGGATIAVALAPVMAGWGLPAGVAATLALVAVTVLVSYLSLVLGELAPKRIALQRTEGVAMFTAAVLDRLATVFRPVIWLLARSTNAVVRLIGLDPKADRDEVTEEELRDMVRTHAALGTEQRRVLIDVFAASDRSLDEVMVPRTQVAFLHADTPLSEAAREIADQPHSRYPVIEHSADEVLGFVHVRDVLTAAHRPGGSGRTLRELARPVIMLPGSKEVLPALSELRRSGHLAVVVDEYGGTDGIVTLEDLVEELVGEISDEYDPRTPATPSSREPDILEGLTHRDDVEARTGAALPEGAFQTLSGFVMERLGRIPEAGDQFEELGYRFTVVSMHRRHPHQVKVEKLSPDDTAQE